jgi:hypothetical protein
MANRRGSLGDDHGAEAGHADVVSFTTGDDPALLQRSARLPCAEHRQIDRKRIGLSASLRAGRIHSEAGICSWFGAVGTRQPSYVNDLDLIVRYTASADSAASYICSGPSAPRGKTVPSYG